MKLIEDLTVTDMAGLFHQASVNTGGDLLAARNLVYSHFDLEDRKLTAKVIAGLAEKDNIGFTWRR